MFTTRGTKFDKAINDIFENFNEPIWKTSFFSQPFPEFPEFPELKGYVVENGILYVALPGFSKEDIEVSIEGRTLIISAEISDEDSNSFRKSFTKKFQLAENTSDEVTATMEDGLLSLSFGKNTEKKKVNIS